MAKPFKGTINLDIRDSIPDWEPFEQPRAPEGAPNVMFIVWDDTGFGAEQMLVSDEKLATGPCVLGVEFRKESQTPQATTGTFTLFIDDREVGELEGAKIQNGKFALCGEGLNIGRGGGAPVTPDYPLERPWALVGAMIRQVIVDVSGEPYLDLEKEAAAMMSRD